MAYRFQHRRDTEVNWQGIILADGEIGMIQRNGVNTNLYKIGDGKTAFENLPLYGFNGTLSNTLDVSDGEQTSNEAVSKDVLVTKFASLDEALTKLSTKEELKALSDLVDDNKNEFDSFKTGEFKTLSDTVSSHSTTISEHTEAIGSINETIIKQGEDIEKLNEDLTKTKEDIVNKHQVLSQQEFDVIDKEDGVFYYIYEETE